MHAARTSIRDIYRRALRKSADCSMQGRLQVTWTQHALSLPCSDYHSAYALPTCGSLAENVGVALQYHAQQRADEFTAVCGIMLVQWLHAVILQLHAMPYRFIYFTSSRG